MSNDRLYPANPNAKAFFEYFTHHWDFIVAPVGTKDWQTITEHKLQPRVLWRKFQDIEQILGVRFGKVTRYGMVDVDRASVLHFANNPQAFRDLCHAFELIGLCRFVIIFSSMSEGVHIYFPLEEEINTFNLACALRMAVESAGFKIKGGQLELFPNTKTYKKNKYGNDFSHFNGHRLPLQPKTGSTLLDDSLNPYSQDLGTFFGQMDWAASGQDIEKLKEVLPLAKEWYSKRYYRFAKASNSSKSKVRQWQEDTEALIEEGFTDEGQTNELIREIGKYGRVFLALEGTELLQYMVETVTNLPGYKEYCRHQHEIEQRCHHWAKIIEPFWWALGTTPTRHTSYPEMSEEGQQKAKNSLLNLQRAEDCLKRLQDTLAYLAQQAISLPQKVGERIKLLCKTSKQLFGKSFSEGTLKKTTYKPFWHPKYDETSAVLDVREPGIEENNAESTDTKLNLLSEIQNNSSFSASLREKNKLQQDIPVKSRSDRQCSKKIAPPDVVCRAESEKECPKPILDKQSSQKDRTPPYMKGFVGLTPYLVYRVFMLKLKLVKQKLKQQLESLLVPEIKTSETKLKEIRKARRKNCHFYHGIKVSSRSGLTRRGDKLISLKPGMKVKILTDSHSSSLSDDNREIMVYVRPSEIKTKEKYLVPLNTLIRITTNSDSYVKAILPQIKALLAALGLTREDYLEHIQRTYGAKNTGQLWSSEIFEVVTHLQNLVNRMFGADSLRSLV